MAKQVINTGTAVNSKNGDPLRTAFTKVNANFTELYTLTGGTAADLQELAQDYAAPLFNHASHTNITATYDDANSKILLTGVAAQVQSNWTATTGLGVILNKPVLFSGSYTDLTNKPTIPGGVGDFVFTNGSASLPLGNTMTLNTYQNGGNKESKLTLAPTGDSALDVGGGLRVRTFYGTGFEKSWTFNTDGSVTFPDASVQTTAFTGLIANGTKASNAAGTAGQTSYDSDYFYICTATNTWRRVALGSTY